LSIGTVSQSTVVEILGTKPIGVMTLPFRVMWLHASVTRPFDAPY